MQYACSTTYQLCLSSITKTLCWYFLFFFRLFHPLFLKHLYWVFVFFCQFLLWTFTFYICLTAWYFCYTGIYNKIHINTSYNWVDFCRIFICVVAHVSYIVAIVFHIRPYLETIFFLSFFLFDIDVLFSLYFYLFYYINVLNCFYLEVDLVILISADWSPSSSCAYVLYILLSCLRFVR